MSMITVPTSSHVSWISMQDSGSGTLGDESRPTSRAMVTVNAVDRTGLLATASRAIAKQRFNIESVTANRMRAITGDCAAFLGAEFLVGIRADPRRPHATEDAYRTMTEQLALVVQDPPPPAMPEEIVRLGLAVRADQDKSGILAQVTAVLAENRANIVWVAGGATRSEVLGRDIFAVEMRVEFPRHEAARLVPSVGQELERLAKRNGWQTNLHGSGYDFEIKP